MNFLFTYGTLRVNEPNAVILQTESQFIKTCTTVEKYIMLSQKSKSFPFIFPIEYMPSLADSAVHVVGDVYSVSDKGLHKCDALEGHPTWYERKEIQVQTNSGSLITVHAYLLTKSSVDELNMNRMVVLKGDWKEKIENLDC